MSSFVKEQYTVHICTPSRFPLASPFARSSEPPRSGPSQAQATAVAASAQSEVGSEPARLRQALQSQASLPHEVASYLHRFGHFRIFIINQDVFENLQLSWRVLAQDCVHDEEHSAILPSPKRLG